MTQFLFVATVFVVAALAGRALPRNPLLMIVLALAYLVVPALLALSGKLDRYDPLPAPALLVVLVATILTLVVSFSRVGESVAAGVGFAGLVGYQVFRVPVEVVLHRLYADGSVPVQMTYAGRNFDIVTGVTAGLLGLWLARRSGPAPRGLILVWNLLGLALLANIVVIAVLSTPVPFRRFLEEPPNRLPSTFPYVWLPTFLVQAALFGHLVVFRKLRASARHGA